MNNRERLLAILERRSPDRIPWIPRLELWYNARVLTRSLPPQWVGLSLREIERAQQEAEEAERRAAEALEETPPFGVLAATFREESAATDSLEQLIDAGYDGTLVSESADGTVLYQVHIGPYPTVDSAREAAAVIRESFGLAPTVILETEAE